MKSRIGKWTSCTCDVHVCCRDTTSPEAAPRLKQEKKIRSYPNPLVCRSLHSVDRLLGEESPQTPEQEPSTRVCGRSKDHMHLLLFRCSQGGSSSRGCRTHRLQWRRGSSRAVREAAPGQAASASLRPQSSGQTQAVAAQGKMVLIGSLQSANNPKCMLSCFPHWSWSHNKPSLFLTWSPFIHKIKIMYIFWRTAQTWRVLQIRPQRSLTASAVPHSTHLCYFTSPVR